MKFPFCQINASNQTYNTNDVKVFSHETENTNRIIDDYTKLIKVRGKKCKHMRTVDSRQKEMRK